jgi:hypothetical protein
MAKAKMGGNASARKSSLTAFDNLIAPGTPVSAKADSPALPADLGAKIIALIKESAEAALRDLRTQPPVTGQSAPAAATAPEPDAAAPEAGNSADVPPAAALPSDPPEVIAPSPPTLSGDAPARSAPALRTINVDTLEPVIVPADRDGRAKLGEHPLLQSQGFYTGLWDHNRTAYPGFGENAGGRASTNPELAGATRFVCIADREGRLTTQQALVGERLLGQMLQQPGGFTLRNKLPAGAPVEPPNYDTMRVFVARACLSLRQAGVLFTSLPAAALLLPPAKAPAFRPIEPDTTVYRLTVSGLRAHVTKEDGEWRLLQGSEVRARVQASAYGPATMRRTELLHCGGLLRTGNVLSTTRDMRFSSSWAAAHFVLGQKPPSDAWKPIARADDAPRPRR